MRPGLRRLLTAGLLATMLPLVPALRPASGEVHHQRARVRRRLPRWYSDGSQRPMASVVSAPAVVVQAGSSVRRKRFVFGEPAVTVDHVSLSRVGIVLYESGGIAISGQVNHDGGPQGSLSGNEVTVTVRAYTATALQGQPVTNAPVLWEWGETVWVRRGIPRTVRAPDEVHELLCRHFDEITHFEFNLEYRRDR